ncbi:spore protease YyaC [Rummeliibacillus stabekisii]|uniref:Sporulation protein n=1 Tax=Rummeliibacillus stabekisii TaxID=241244 RepID=A0A143HGJ6_9BACL|nr:spore protease YyaC [Rummeliibacillus stabekisii]AMX00621.1 sporulation protein [Rummeliibacillus stabekisii]
MTLPISNSAFSYALHYEDSGATWRLSSFLLEHIPFHHENLVFCCIGSDRSTGDALGPLTGSILSNFVSFPYKIIGTLEEPLHALNLSQTVDSFENHKVPPFVVAIDACLGDQKRIGEILFQPGPLLPGKAVKKELPPIGDVSIKGIVNFGGFMEHTILQTTRLNITYEMSNRIARALYLAWHRHSLKKVHQRHYESHN